MANHVKARRTQLKLTQQKVADIAGTTKATVMKLEKGDMQLTENWLSRLALALQCNPQDLISQEWPQDTPLIGEVTGKSEVRLYRELPKSGAYEKDNDYWQGMDVVPRPPESGYRGVVALKVVDDAMEPLLSKGSLVYYAEPVTNGIDDLIDKFVVCELTDGQVHVARLQRGYSFSSYNLLKPNAAPINDVTLNWCSKVIFLKPA